MRKGDSSQRRLPGCGDGNTSGGLRRAPLPGAGLLLPLAVLIGLLLISLPFLPVDAGAAEQSKQGKQGKGGKGAGVDEAVIEKIAGEHGREAKEPLIGDDQGDILLFLFLLAGAVGGFVAGYYWRVLITEKKEQDAAGEASSMLSAGGASAEKRE